MAGRRRWGAVVVVLGSCLSLAGCGDGPRTPPIAPYTAPTTPPAFDPTTSDPRASPPASHVDGYRPAVSATVLDESQSVGLESVAWAYATDDSASSSVTVVAADGGGCDNPAGVGVRETAGEVTLLVFSRYVQPAGFACNGDLHLHMYVVPLAAPLGTRSLLHGPTRRGDAFTL